MKKAREQFRLAPESSIPQFRHDKFWSGSLVTRAIRVLQTDPSSFHAEHFIKRTNIHVQDYNKANGYVNDSGFFPFDHLKKKYLEAHNLMNKHKQADDQDKKTITETFHDLVTSTEEYCSERGFPTKWAWQHPDITKKPDWINPAAKAKFESDCDAARRSESDSDTNTKMADVIEEERASLNDDSKNDTNKNMTDVTYRVTFDGKPIIAKRKVFKTVQYLLQESPELHVWMPARSCGYIEREEISALDLKSKEFIEDRKCQYSGTLWIAMGVDEIITVGFRYPPIAMMVQWLDSHPDSLMWRSDVIKIAGKEKTQSAVMSYLPFHHEFESYGSSISIMAATKAALTNGSSKAIAKFTKQRVKKVAISESIDQQSTPQSTVFKNSAVQPNEDMPNEDLLQMIQTAVQAALQAALQENQRVAAPVTV